MFVVLVARLQGELYTSIDGASTKSLEGITSATRELPCWLFAGCPCAQRAVFVVAG
jgi:hypothetical protein